MEFLGEINSVTEVVSTACHEGVTLELRGLGGERQFRRMMFADVDLRNMEYD